MPLVLQPAGILVARALAVPSSHLDLTTWSLTSAALGNEASSPKSLSRSPPTSHGPKLHYMPTSQSGPGGRHRATRTGSSQSPSLSPDLPAEQRRGFTQGLDFCPRGGWQFRDWAGTFRAATMSLPHVWTCFPGDWNLSDHVSRFYGSTLGLARCPRQSSYRTDI